MNVVNLPHVNTVYRDLKVTYLPDKKVYQVSSHSEDEKFGAIVCELADHSVETLKSDIQDLICKCMKAGYLQCQRDMRRQLGLDK